VRSQSGRLGVVAAAAAAQLLLRRKVAGITDPQGTAPLLALPLGAHQHPLGPHLQHNGAAPTVAEENADPLAAAEAAEVPGIGGQAPVSRNVGAPDQLLRGISSGHRPGPALR